MSATSDNSLVLEPTGERMVPENSDLFTFWEHVYRYAFASRFVSGKRVLDIACGEGYGAAALQKAGAAQIIGVDISEAVCLHARSKYGLDARPGTAEQIPLPDRSVDVIISFETIEHVPDPHRFLGECVRILVPGGKLVISTPNKRIYGQNGKNPYHCSEMTPEEFACALNSRFHDPRFYTQRPHSAAWWSPRTLACENPPWGSIRGSRRLRRLFQRWTFPEGIQGPTEEQRRSAIEIVMKVAASWPLPLNHYVVRPQRMWHREKSVYMVAVAMR
jgi:2-polyprenyl-3-methyl-5-hydroxy-6-metoxy-1,4-benzoquinol methylase